MNNLTIFDIANFFRSKESMTHKKLQKLVYYAYAWYIALYNEKSSNIVNKLCLDTKFEAWVHGPVSRILYNKYSNSYGIIDKFNGSVNKNITGELKSFLENIYSVFGKQDVSLSGVDEFYKSFVAIPCGWWME